MSDAALGIGRRVLVIGMAGPGRAPFALAFGEDWLAGDSP